MKNAIHAHELINFLLERNYSKEDLKKVVSKKFEENAKFTNCSGNVFTFDEALTFMEKRGKITIKNGKIFANKEEICDH